MPAPGLECDRIEELFETDCPKRLDRDLNKVREGAIRLKKQLAPRWEALVAQLDTITVRRPVGREAGGEQGEVGMA